MESLQKCSICLSDLSGQEVAKPLKCECKVAYHQVCMDKWRNTKNECPICHKNFDLILIIDVTDNYQLLENNNRVVDHQGEMNNICLVTIALIIIIIIAIIIMTTY